MAWTVNSSSVRLSCMRQVCYGIRERKRNGAVLKPARDIGRLIELMAALRTPGSGCPWDLQQNFETIAAAFVTVRALIREARTRCRWDTRPTTRRLK